MSAALSKRQQARNEKALQDLVHNVSGNSFCADCGTRNPGWASWSLGIFLCMRCAAIHRKLGTHVSKVKSLSMDSWTNEQVENMKKVGNINSNKTYNPQNKKPPVPIDADEADSAMERFIRLKYMGSGLGTTKRHNTGSTESDETPPPLPPKTPSRFGFRSASSIFPLSSKAKKEAAAHEMASNTRDLPRSPPRRHKASRVFGGGLEYDGDDTDKKLAQLRDMGFTDDQRNAVVLKGVNGNLERTVEALIRLGEGGRRSPLSRSSTRDDGFSTNRSLTPATPASSVNPPLSAKPISPSNNPFDMPPAQPQSSQSTGTLQNKNPYLGTNNPFGVPQHGDHALNQALQNMSLGPSQPLFPHHTGGIPAPQQQSPVTVYQQSMTPPIPSMPQMSHNYPSMGFNSSQTYPQPVPPSQPSYNPFFTSQQPQHPQPTLSVNTNAFPGNYGNNPFTRSPTRIQSPTLAQIPEQSQQNFYTPPPLPQPMSNPFFNQAGTGLQPQQQQQQQLVQMPQQFAQPFAQPFTQQQPQRADKASIMALYNYPQLAPTPFPTHTQQDQSQAFAAQPLSATTQQPQQQQQPQHHPAGAAPGLGSLNPFLSNGSAITQTKSAQQPSALIDMSPAKQHNVSRDSMMALSLEWTNGRHSPDAFASLSARDVR